MVYCREARDRRQYTDEETKFVGSVGRDRRQLRERSVWYPLHEVLFIFLAAVICGATSYVKVEMFGKSKEKWLKKYIKLENGIPDACTFRNVVKAIDTRQLHTMFIEWMKDAVAARRIHRPLSRTGG